MTRLDVESGHGYRFAADHSQSPTSGLSFPGLLTVIVSGGRRPRAGLDVLNNHTTSISQKV